MPLAAPVTKKALPSSSRFMRYVLTFPEKVADIGPAACILRFDDLIEPHQNVHRHHRTAVGGLA